MKKLSKTISVALTAATALVVSLSGCSTGTPTNGSSGSGGAKPQSITVWSMNGDLSPEVLKAINERFTKETGVAVKLEQHTWDGITTKVTTALTTSTPPDVIDVGNTQLSGYAANGGLLDITAHKTDLEQGKTWLTGLENSATVNGKLYGAPALLAPFAVLYNKKIWSAAGITGTPKTYAELEQDLNAIKANNSASDFSPFYLCGQDWYSALQWVWASGGGVAKQHGNHWQGVLSNAASIQGLNEWKAFQNKYSNAASRTLNTDNPDQIQLFAAGKVGAMVAPSTSIATIVNLKSGITQNDIGSFAIPTTNGKLQPTFTSGSDWVVPAKGKNSDWSLKWIKIATSPDIQQHYVFGKQQLNPITVEGNKEILASKATNGSLTGFSSSASVSVATPSAPGWLKVEGNRVLNDFFSSIATGSSTPEQAAAKADGQLNTLLNSAN